MNTSANTVHALCHFIHRVTIQVFPHRIAVKATARLFNPARVLLRSAKQLIRKGDRCFHTTSITPGIGFVNLDRKRDSPVNLKFPVGPQNRDEGDPLFWTKKVRDPSSTSGSNWEFQVKDLSDVGYVKECGLQRVCGDGPRPR